MSVVAGELACAGRITRRTGDSIGPRTFLGELGVCATITVARRTSPKSTAPRVNNGQAAERKSATASLISAFNPDGVHWRISVSAKRYPLRRDMR
jgi:hypothetical protein